MEITTDIILKGNHWRKALSCFEPFLTQRLLPNYSLYVISISIGIMYDIQESKAGDEVDDDIPVTVPRTVLHNHNSELDFLFQTAILTSNLVNLSVDDRLKLAFDDNCDIKFNKFDFLTKFAYYGVAKILELCKDDPTEMMMSFRDFLISSIEGYNFEIGAVSEDELDLEDINKALENNSSKD